MPPNETKPEATGEFYKKTSTSDPLAQTKPAINQSDYKFILEDKPKSRFSLRLPNAPKAVLIPVGILFALILLIVVSSILSGRGKGAYVKLSDVVAQQQEITRVNRLIDPYTKDTNLKALATTVNVTLAGSQSKLTGYFVKNHYKLQPQKLNARRRAETDSDFKNAYLNNRFEPVYYDRLKQNLKDYQANMQTVRPQVGPNGQKILDEATANVKVLLTAPELVNL